MPVAAAVPVHHNNERVMVALLCKCEVQHRSSAVLYSICISSAIPWQSAVLRTADPAHAPLLALPNDG
jgi:hypothetical protein